jgi:hypothetical protein
LFSDKMALLRFFNLKILLTSVLFFEPGSIIDAHGPGSDAKDF